jgi:hypothetical protein
MARASRAKSAFMCLPHIFCQYNLDKFEAEPALKALQKAQVKWECWGLMSQWYNYAAEAMAQRQLFIDQVNRLRKEPNFESYASSLAKTTFERQELSNRL